MSVLSGGSAHAACTLTLSGGATVDCSGDFEADLDYDSTLMDLTITNSGGGVTTVSTDLSGNDSITLNGVSSSNLDVFEDGDNRINLRGGDDVVRVIDGDLTGEIFGGDGDDVIEFVGGGNPIPATSGGTDITFDGGPGNDTAIVGAGVDVGEIFGGSGDDTITIEGSVLPGGTVFSEFAVGGDSGNDLITLGVDSFVDGDVGGGSGNDLIVSDGSVNGNVVGGSGNDRIVSSGAVGVVMGGSGDDEISLLAGSVDGVQGNDGDDLFTLGGGALNGPVTGFETVVIDPTLGSDAISGDLDITGTGTADIAFNNIDAPDLSLDAISISGFSTGTVNNSVIGPLFGILGIGTLTVNDSRLNFIGATSLLGDGSGRLVANNSRLDFINGVAGDTLTLGQFAFNSSTLGIDVNPLSGGFGDEVIVTGGSGAFTATGDNVVLVNFTDPVDPTVARDIAVVGVSGAGSGVLAENFTATAVGNNASPLVALTLVDRPGVGLVLETREAVTVTPPPAAVNTTQAAFAGDTINDINNDLVGVLAGFGGGAGRVAVTPQFGIFSNGSFGYTDHDGFDVSGGGQSLTTPAFDANSFSLIGVGELDASAEFGLADNDIGLRLSAFGGYVENEVTFSRNDGAGGITPFRGEGTNTGGVVGGTALASKLQGAGNLNYGLISGAFFFGDTDVTNAATGGTGSYGTTGYVLSGKLGRNMAVADRLRLDLRVGGSYQTFRGTSFTDTTGVVFGSSEVSYGLLSFEPGVSTSVAVGEYIVSPSARAIFQARVGYNNSATIQGVNFDFDDGDLLLGGQLGAATRFNDRLSGGVFVEGRLTEDSRALLGKLSLKYTIPKS